MNKKSKVISVRILLLNEGRFLNRPEFNSIRDYIDDVNKTKPYIPLSIRR